MGIAELFGRRGILSTALELETAPAAPVAKRTFAVGDDLATWQALVVGTTPLRVSRAEAMSVPAVKRARDLIAGTLATLPIHAFNSAGERIDHALLDQPEAPLGYVRAVTIARTVTDLLMDGASLWLVILRTAAGFPQAVQRVEYGQWSQDPDGTIRVNGREVDTRDVVLFTSANDALLVVGARAIRALIALEDAALTYACEPEAAHYFTSRDGVDPDAEDVAALLTAWRAARRAGSVAYVPSAYELAKADRSDPEQLQLISAREFAVKEIARVTGIDAEELSVSTTSRTYANIQDRNRLFVQQVLSPFMAAVEQRLSLGDVTPRGQRVRFVLDGFLRADTLERYQAHKIGLDAGFLTVNEVRDMENRPTL